MFISEVGNRTIRPQLFSYLFFLLMLLIVSAADSGRLRALWLAPLVIAAWANFHGGFLAGLGLLAVWSMARLAMCQSTQGDPVPFSSDENRDSPRQAAIKEQVALASSLLPDHVAGAGRRVRRPAEPLRLQVALVPRQTATVPRPDISEWQPVDIAKPEGIAYLALIGVAILAIATSTRRRSPALIAALGCTAVLPHAGPAASSPGGNGGGRAGRAAPGRAWERWLGSVPFPRRDCPIVAGTQIFCPPKMGRVPFSGHRLMAAVLPLTGALLLSGATWRHWTRIPIDPARIAYPVRAVDLLKTSGAGKHGRVLRLGRVRALAPRPARQGLLRRPPRDRLSGVVAATQRQLGPGTGRWDALSGPVPNRLGVGGQAAGRPTT